MSLLSEWRLTRERRRRAGVYLAALTGDVAPADVMWLQGFALPGNEGCAARELTFARRAVALIVAERDALDDRTASDVAHELASVIDAQGRRDPAAGRLWSERWRAYTSALAARGASEAPAARLARVMLAGCGVETPSAPQLVRATQYMLATRSAANDALRTAFGAASLPDDLPPSAVKAATR